MTHPRGLPICASLKQKRMKRKIFQAFVLIGIVSFSSVNAQQTGEVTPSGIGYLQYLPDGYTSGSKKFPLVISLHGIREKGTSSTNRAHVLKDLDKVANVGMPKYVKQGKKFPFVLISPQLKGNHGSWSPDFVMEVLKYVKQDLRIDEERIYLTGLSLGGYGVWKTAGEYPGVFAAIAPICPGGNALSQANAIAAANVAAWGFHGSSDHIVSHTVTTNMINALNSAPKKPNPLAKVTIFNGMGHNIWDNAYLETNLLSWLLGFKKGGSSSSGSADDSAPSNKAPSADAGNDRTITLPENTLTLTGSGADPDGKITDFQWKQVSGTQAGMDQSTPEELKVFDLKQGEYVFRLTVKDNEGADGSDDVMVTVKAQSNQSPEVNAGGDRTLTLPDNAISLTGTASDPDGKITSYEWTQISGGHSNLSGTASEKLQATDLKEGSYVFRLAVKDDDGASSADEVRVTVNSATNRPPEVDAGPDKNVTLPANLVNVEGIASDPDGAIKAYSWVQTSGPAASLSGENTSLLNVTQLLEGTYTFRLTVTDDAGANSSDDLQVSVRKASGGTLPPVVDAGSDRTLTMPDNSVILQGQASDEDGEIASLQWTQVSGPSANVGQANAAQVSITDMREGIYVFRLEASDNSGTPASDDVKVRVVRNQSSLSGETTQPSDYTGRERGARSPD